MGAVLWTELGGFHVGARKQNPSGHDKDGWTDACPEAMQFGKWRERKIIGTTPTQVGGARQLVRIFPDPHGMGYADKSDWCVSVEQLNKGNYDDENVVLICAKQLTEAQRWNVEVVNKSVLPWVNRI